MLYFIPLSWKNEEAKKERATGSYYTAGQESMGRTIVAGAWNGNGLTINLFEYLYPTGKRACLGSQSVVNAHSVYKRTPAESEMSHGTSDQTGEKPQPLWQLEWKQHKYKFFKLLYQKDQKIINERLS